MRFRITDRAGVLKTPPEKALIWAFWHNRLLVMAYVFERYFHSQGRTGVTLTSQSKDGEYIAAVIREFGIRPIRGSTSRGGARSLVAMKRAVEDGDIIAITPDGPRGPRYSLGAGVVKLAQVTQGGILPVRVTYSSFWQLKSWDGFMIPKPFCTVEIVFDVVIPVPRTTGEEAFEEQRGQLEQILQPLPGE